MSLVTQKALYGKMAGDSTLTNLLASPPTGYSKSIYYEIAPTAATFPYVIFQEQASTPTYSFTAVNFDNEVWTIKGVDRSTSSTIVRGIADRLDALLTDGTISISGKTQRYLRRESGVSYSEVSGDQRFIHAGHMFRLVFT